jgi:hypothetical protein
MLLITWMSRDVFGCSQTCIYDSTYSRFKINKNSTRDVMFIVCLIEKHVLSIATFGRPFFENTLLVYTMLGTQPLPVHGTHFQGPIKRNSLPRQPERTLIATLSKLNGHYFSRHRASSSCHIPSHTHPCFITNYHWQ